MSSIGNLVNASKRYRRIELWGSIILFTAGIAYFVLSSLAADRIDQATKFTPQFEKAGMPYDHYINYFLPHLIRLVFAFGAFLYLNFMMVPRLLLNQDMSWNIVRTILVFFVTGFMFGATNVLLKEFVYGIQSIEATLLELYGTGFLYAGFWFVVFGFYTITKYAVVYMVDSSSQRSLQNSFVRKEGVVAFLVWAVLLILMLVTDTVTIFTLLWIVIVPPGIMLYLLSFYLLIPESFSKPKPFRSYCSRMILILAALFLPVAAFVWVILQDGPPSVMLSILNTFFQLFVTLPFSWKLYKKYIKTSEEITTLKKELGQSTASYDFLRSQINPHFLFNALNTLYGTAIEENSERTSEGIQKLGDMMRFMLHDNMQDKIPLSREIDYMNNYISLQKLRTDAKDNVQIETNITEDTGVLQIAPMLLISFIENAFKHGISFRQPSHIRIDLECRDNTVYFHVNNSKHQRRERDPEKDKSGVGLDNVKQRLLLLYPGKHELIIGESDKDFSIRLTIQLT